jgi:antitoxin component YwqK of YwqJK toxin-antitoxin module
MRRFLVGNLIVALGIAGISHGVAEAETGDPKCPGGTALMGAKPPIARKQWCSLADGTQHGPSISYYATGEPMARAEFDGGALVGQYQAWHPNGQLAEIATYAEDRRHGPSRAWDLNGNLLTEENYRKGELHGVTRIWFASGQLRVEAHYENGRRQGSVATFYADGQKQTEGEFRDDVYHGTWRGWYPDGTLEKVAEFDEGKLLSREEFPAGSEGGG